MVCPDMKQSDRNRHRRRHRMVTAKPTAQLPNQPQDLDDYIAAA